MNKPLIQKYFFRSLFITDLNIKNYAQMSLDDDDADADDDDDDGAL